MHNTSNISTENKEIMTISRDSAFFHMQIYGYLFMSSHLHRILHPQLIQITPYIWTNPHCCSFSTWFYVLHFPYLHLGTKKKIIYCQPKSELAGSHGSNYQHCKNSRAAPTCYLWDVRMLGIVCPAYK